MGKNRASKKHTLQERIRDLEIVTLNQHREIKELKERFGKMIAILSRTSKPEENAVESTEV